MGDEPIEDIAFMEGGPLDGDSFPCRWAKITFPVNEAGEVPRYVGRAPVVTHPGRVTYADSGRRDADGRRVFVVKSA